MVTFIQFKPLLRTQCLFRNAAYKFSLFFPTDRVSDSPDLLSEIKESLLFFLSRLAFLIEDRILSGMNRDSRRSKFCDDYIGCRAFAPDLLNTAPVSLTERQRCVFKFAQANKIRLLRTLRSFLNLLVILDTRSIL